MVLFLDRPYCSLLTNIENDYRILQNYVKAITLNLQFLNELWSCIT